jgi:hypothetical protein
MDPLTKAYLKIITESEDLQKGQKVEGETSQTGKVFGNAESEKNKAPQKKTGPEAVDGDIEDPEESPKHLTQSAETSGEPKPNKVSYEAKNPFDALYNKILSEEGEQLSFSTAKNPEDSSFGIAEPFGGESSEEVSDEFGEEDEESEEGEEVTFSLPRDLAEKLHEVLMSVLSNEEEGEEGEDFGSEEDFGGSEEGESEESEESENPFKEATDMQELASAQGLSLTDKSKKEVKGAVPVTKKAAQTPATGKGHDGALKACSTETGVSKHTAKGSNKVGSVDKVDKSLFEQD